MLLPIEWPRSLLGDVGFSSNTAVEILELNDPIRAQRIDSQRPTSTSSHHALAGAPRPAADRQWRVLRRQ